MNITERSLRKLIREEISSSYVTPVDGLTSLMQEFDVPMHSRKKISKTVQDVCSQNGGPLDASYEVERTLGLSTVPEEFYNQAVELIRKDPRIHEDTRRFQTSRRQINLFLKEAMNPSDSPVLTEAELNEIAPMIGKMFASLGSKAVGKFGDVMAKGAVAVGKKIASNPKLQSAVMSMVKKASEKLPELKQYIDATGVDLDNVSPDQLQQMFDNEKIRGSLDKVLKQGSDQLEKAEGCPSLEELQAAQRDN